MYVRVTGQQVAVRSSVTPNRATARCRLGVAAFFPVRSVVTRMRDEEEIREQYEFLKDHLESDEMRHDGVEEMFTYYKRAIGWVLEEEHM
ncbi:hypothetical protein NJ7G_3416 [Natrinema sp. J7-2]|nr:hypothetical protein NJ7G_3416 [Natrinema sp. J7-2]